MKPSSLNAITIQLKTLLLTLPLKLLKLQSVKRVFIFTRRFSLENHNYYRLSHIIIVIFWEALRKFRWHGKMFTEYDVQESCLVIVKDIINFRRKMFTFFVISWSKVRWSLENRFFFTCRNEATPLFLLWQTWNWYWRFPPFLKFLFSNAEEFFGRCLHPLEDEER
jgi:hypothetical protein